jgi:glutaconate CoA-transferase subunit B
MMQTYPGPYAVRRGDVDFGFGSGVQVDRHGNVNSTLIGDPARPDVALVGSILLPEHMSLFGREYLMIPHHNPRVLVGQVDYVSGVGFPGGRRGRADLGIGLPRPGDGGPRWIVTPMGIFGFDEEGQAQPAYRHADIEPAALAESTGFPVGDLTGLPTTPPPTADELDLLRRVIDPRGLLVRRPQI